MSWRTAITVHENAPLRPVWSEVDLDGGPRERSRAARGASPRPHVLAVVKANGYGHGAVPGRARRARRRRGLARASRWSKRVSQLREARHRRADPRCCRAGARRRLPSGRHALDHAGRLHGDGHRRARQGGGRSAGADRRCGAPEDRHRDAPRRAAPRRRARARRARSTPVPSSTLAGVCTHLAVADDPDDPYTARQLDAVRGGRSTRSRRAGDRRPASCTRPTRPAALAYPSTPLRPRPVGIAAVRRAAGAVVRPTGRAPSRSCRSVPRVMTVRDARRRRAPLVRAALRAAARQPHRHRVGGVRRRRAAQPRARRRRGADRRPAPSHRRDRHDGPAHGRRGRRRGRGGRRGRAHRHARAPRRSPPTSGPSASAPSPTRSSPASVPRVPRRYRP